MARDLETARAPSQSREDSAAQPAPPDKGSQILQFTVDPITIVGTHAALQAATRTGLLQLLCTGAHTAPACAEKLKLNLRATEYVLEVLAKSGLLANRGGQYQLNNGTPSATLTALEIQEFTQRQFDSTTHFLKTGESTLWVDESTRKREASYSSCVGALGKLFHEAANNLAGQLRRPLPRILDVGCGSGVWSLAIAAGDPQSHVTGLDFPAVLEAFVSWARGLGMEGQIATLPGDMHQVDLPQEHFDLAVIANVLRLEAPERARQLVARVVGSIRPGGCLLVVDALAGGTSEKELLRAVYALHLALRTNVGRVYSAAQIRVWMGEAGLCNISELDTGIHVAALGGILGVRP
jgi:SAM-dependent methyltransferase